LPGERGMAVNEGGLTFACSGLAHRLRLFASR
jgi:hypothetical protein